MAALEDRANCVPPIWPPARPPSSPTTGATVALWDRALTTEARDLLRAFACRQP